MSEAYDRLEKESKQSKSIRDWTERWERLTPVGQMNGQIGDAIQRFCDRKRITLNSLAALGTRVKIGDGGRIELAYAGTNPGGTVIAIKYRPIDQPSSASYAEKPSRWLRPHIIGNRDSKDWLIDEGETDGARLHGLVGDSCAIMVLPAGASTFEEEWAGMIPRGARVFLCYDADQAGDLGATKAARLLGNGTVRVMPPDGANDWCDWDGTRDDLVELLQAAADTRKSRLMSLADVEMRSIIYVEKPLWQGEAMTLVVGRKGVGKGTLEANKAARVTRGELGPKRNVIWIGTEDSAEIDIKPRIVAAGGDPSRVYVRNDWWLQLPRDIDELNEEILSIGDVGLVVIDPVGNHIKGKNSDSETDIRDAISPLNDLAHNHQLMCDIVRHLSEKDCSRGILAAILGSSAWVQVPRAVVAVAVDPGDATLRHVQVVGGNRIPPGSTGRAFKISGHQLEGLTEPVTKAEWVGDSTQDVEQLLKTSSDGGSRAKPGAVREATIEFLTGGHWHSRDSINDYVTSETGCSPDSVYRCALKPLKDENHAQCKKEGLREWYWRLTEKDWREQAAGAHADPLEKSVKEAGSKSVEKSVEPLYTPTTDFSSRAKKTGVENSLPTSKSVFGCTDITTEFETLQTLPFAKEHPTESGGCFRHTRDDPREWCHDCVAAGWTGYSTEVAA